VASGRVTREKIRSSSTVNRQSRIKHFARLAIIENDNYLACFLAYLLDWRESTQKAAYFIAFWWVSVTIL
jgi:hypothetical protein